jgi:hypothetical protein
VRDSVDIERPGSPKSGAGLLDRLDWAQIRRLALDHKKALWIANGVAVMAVLCSVPIPLLLPLLVDEVLLGKGNSALIFMNQFLPQSLQKPVGYIGLMLVTTLCLRLGALLFNVISGAAVRRPVQGHRLSHPDPADRTPQAYFPGRIREPGQRHGDRASGDRSGYAGQVRRRDFE